MHNDKVLFGNNNPLICEKCPFHLYRRKSTQKVIFGLAMSKSQLYKDLRVKPKIIILKVYQKQKCHAFYYQLRRGFKSVARPYSIY